MKTELTKVQGNLAIAIQAEKKAKAELAKTVNIIDEAKTELFLIGAAVNSMLQDGELNEDTALAVYSKAHQIAELFAEISMNFQVTEE